MKSWMWPNRKAPACGLRKARWSCKFPSQRLTSRSRCGICPCLKSSARRPARSSSGPIPPFGGDRKPFLDQLSHALHAGMIIAYAQGMAVLAAASDKYAYHLDLEAVARIWRGGCIIRAALLEDIRMAYRNQPGLLESAPGPGVIEKGNGQPGGFAPRAFARQSKWVCPHPVS